MKKVKFFFVYLICLSVMSINSYGFEKDIIKTSKGDLAITFVGHGTLMFEFGGKVIHVDPVGRYADYSSLPNADLILITHEHGDHLDKAAIGTISKPGTEIILTKACTAGGIDGKVLNNGESGVFAGLNIEAVPAYNIKHGPSAGIPFHPKGTGNGYVIQFGDKKVYVAGDTEDIPEMAGLKAIDIAFLPMNLPYTMTPEMVAGAAKVIKPKILYPYHFGNTDTSKLVDLLKDQKETDVRIRKLN